MTDIHQTAQQSYLALSRGDWEELFTSLTRAELGVYFALKTRTTDELELVDIETLAEDLGLHRTSISRAINSLNNNGFINIRPKKSIQRVQYRVRARLQSNIGGHVDVITTVGHIDIVTDTEVIEVKPVKDWKAALGQILIHSSAFPTHSKRLHLYGSREQLSKLAEIKSACLMFNVLVTGEEV